jgi:hypothetical protein
MATRILFAKCIIFVFGIVMCAGCQLTSDDTGNNRVSDTIDFDSGQPNDGDDDSRFDTETGDDEAEAGTISINVSVATSGDSKAYFRRRGPMAAA